MLPFHRRMRKVVRDTKETLGHTHAEQLHSTGKGKGKGKGGSAGGGKGSAPKIPQTDNRMMKGNDKGNKKALGKQMQISVGVENSPKKAEADEVWVDANDSEEGDNDKNDNDEANQFGLHGNKKDHDSYRKGGDCLSTLSLESVNGTPCTGLPPEACGGVFPDDVVTLKKRYGARLPR
jgi:hypothetical protein